MAINFFSEDISFELKHKTEIKTWLKEVARSEARKTGIINYIFCSDEYLWKMNKQFLDHDTYTDIITFDHSTEHEQISGDIFISVERVKENAKELGQSFEDELHRVMAHGIFHLMGYNDKTEDERAEMRQKEDNSLSLRPF